MNRRWICSDVWMDILPSFERVELGLKMALLSDRFDILVDTHFDGKSELRIWRIIRIDKDKGPKAQLSVRVNVKFVAFPFPDRPLPIKIRFKDLSIQYIDHSVIEFLRSNKQIWDRNGTNLDLFIDGDQKRNWDVFTSEIWPIFAPNIRHLYFPNADHLDNLRHRTSPTILTDLDHLNSINSYGLFPDAIGDDGPNATAGQVLSQWLHTPSKDGQPKRLHCHDYFDESDLEWVNNFKEAFLHATTSVSYNIRITFYYTMPNEPFELVNERTNEKLTLTKERDRDGEISDWLLKRCPISVGETSAAVQKDDNLHHLNGVNFILYNDSIGPMSPPDQSDEKVFSTPGPSDQQKNE